MSCILKPAQPVRKPQYFEGKVTHKRNITGKIIIAAFRNCSHGCTFQFEQRSQFDLAPRWVGVLRPCSLYNMSGWSTAGCETRKRLPASAGAVAVLRYHFCTERKLRCAPRDAKNKRTTKSQRLNAERFFRWCCCCGTEVVVSTTFSLPHLVLAARACSCSYCTNFLEQCLRVEPSSKEPLGSQQQLVQIHVEALDLHSSTNL